MTSSVSGTRTITSCSDAEVTFDASERALMKLIENETLASRSALQGLAGSNSNSMSFPY